MNSAQSLETGCPICKIKQAKLLFVMEGVPVAKEGIPIVRCSRCGLIYQSPPLATEEHREYYENIYYDDFGDRISVVQKSRFSLYKDIPSKLTRYRKTGRLLDVGSGYGDFLKVVRDQGWEAWGVDPSRKACEFAQTVLKLQVFNQSLEEAHFPENHFDVITLWNVIDCFSDPMGAMRKIQNWLSPGGLLVIRTPNTFFHCGIHLFYLRFGPILRKFGWTRQASVFHNTNFDRSTLKKLLEDTGFCSIRIENGQPTEGDAYQVFTHTFLMALGKFVVSSAAFLISLLSGRRILIGSSMMAYASKATSRPKFRPATMRLRIFLKSVILHFLAVIGYLLGFPLWLKILGKDRGLRILSYHSIHQHRKHEVNVRESDFERQLDFLKDHYEVVSLEAAMETLQKGCRSRRPQVTLTFDDGYEDNYRVAYPILRKRELPATIFLLTGDENSERRLVHLWDDEPQYNRLLSWDQVREMLTSGITYGSHSVTHAHLSYLSMEEARYEIFSSKEKIERETGQPVRFISYPYGAAEDFDQRIEFLAREAGYQAGFSAVFGTSHSLRNRYHLQRIGIEASDTLFTFRAKLNGALGLLSLVDFPPIRKLIRWAYPIFLEKAPRRPPKKRPILLVTVDFPPHTEGVSTISSELSGRIARTGEEVLVIGPKDRDDQLFDSQQPYRVFRTPGYEWGHLRFIPLFFCLPSVILHHGTRKVFAMNIAYGGVLSWMLSFLCPLEYLIFAYGYEFEKVKKNPLARWLYRRIYHRAKKVIACSELVRERLIQFGGVDPQKIKVLYPAVDLERYHPREVPQEYLEKKKLLGQRILLSVGRLVERKGHDQVLEVLPRILEQFPDVLYCIVGIGEDEEKIRQKTQRLHLEDFVRFLGKVSEEELTFLYNACEIFLMPSREIPEGGHIEGFGIVYLEANACGKPVIGGKSGGVLEAIRDGETGFIVDPNRSEDIAEKIVFLLSHPDRAKAMGQRGLKWVRQTFDWERYTQQAYQWLCENSHP